MSKKTPPQGDPLPPLLAERQALRASHEVQDQASFDTPQVQELRRANEQWLQDHDVGRNVRAILRETNQEDRAPATPFIFPPKLPPEARIFAKLRRPVPESHAQANLVPPGLPRAPDDRSTGRLRSPPRPRRPPRP